MPTKLNELKVFNECLTRYYSSPFNLIIISLCNTKSLGFNFRIEENPVNFCLFNKRRDADGARQKATDTNFSSVSVENFIHMALHYLKMEANNRDLWNVLLYNLVSKNQWQRNRISSHTVKPNNLNIKIV